jgi:ABC-type glycerol-3-phosphate transport system substrate-binding protein
MKKFHRAAALLLALAMLLALGACGGKSDSEDEVSPDAPKYVYVAAYSEMPEEISDMSSCCWYNGMLYFSAYAKSGEESYVDPVTNETVKYDNYAQGLYSVKDDGTGLAQLSNYTKPEVPEGMEGDSSMYRMTVDAEGNLWVCESVYMYTFDLPEGFDETTEDKWQYQTGGSQKYYVRKLDNTGTELLNIDLSNFIENSEEFYISGMEIDSEGRIYIGDGQNTVYVINSDGTLLFKLEAPDTYINNIFRLSDGRVAAMAYASNAEGGNNTITAIDPETKDWGDSMPAPYSAYSFYAGGGEYDFYYNTDSNFFGVDIETGESEKLFNWIGCDIDSSNISTIMPLADGRVLCTTYSYNRGNGEQGACEIVTLTRTDAAQVQSKTILTYACMYMDYNLRGQIIDFNKTNGQYRIEVRDYSEYNTEDDYSAGLTKLSTEIISGEVPDIIDVNSLPIRLYASKGLLEDLWPYIEADPELGRDALVEPVFKALEQDGKLYQISSTFSITTAAGATSMVGDTPGWTLDEMYAALDKLPEGAQVFNQYTIQSDMLQQCCAMGMDEFVNWETGECTFDSEEFIKMLEFASSFPAEFDWEKYDYEADYESDYSRIMNGKQLLVQVSTGDFMQFQMYKAMFGGDVTYIGFPTESRNGSAFNIYSGLAMSSKSENKDGVWQFIRTLLTKEYQEEFTWGDFPTNKEAFDAKLEDAMTPVYSEDPTTGEKTEQPKTTWGWDRDLTVDIYALTQEEADQILDLINSTNKVYSYDQQMFDIIKESAAAFFAGQQSAEEVAQIIQSRCSLYVNEQK